MRTLSKQLMALSLAAVLASAAGCTGRSATTGTGTGTGPAAATAQPSISAVPTITAGNYVALPLDAYGLLGTETDTITRAMNILDQKCMAGKGFTSWTAGPVDSAADAPTSFNDYPIRPASASDAAAYGYQKPSAPATSAAAAQNVTNAEWLALTGTSLNDIQATPRPDNCVSTTSKQLLAGRPAANEDLAGQLAESAGNEAGADSRVITAYKAWSSCMQQSGFTYANPQDPANKNWGGKQAGSLEIATAATDYQCRQPARAAAAGRGPGAAAGGPRPPARRAAERDVRRGAPTRSWGFSAACSATRSCCSR